MEDFPPPAVLLRGVKITAAVFRFETFPVR
jgi:hypothetical protein